VFITLVNPAGAVLRMLYTAYRAALVMAQGTGEAGWWSPAGTQAPTWWPARRTAYDDVRKKSVEVPNPWRGSYLGASQQRILGSDGHALAAAIEKGMALMPATSDEARRLGPFAGSRLTQPGNLSEEPQDEDIARPYQHLFPLEMRQEVARLVAFLRAVPADGVIEVGLRPAVRMGVAS